MDYRSYWEKNIDRWGEFYLDISHGHETLNAPPWASRLYRSTIGRIEARLMRERYRLTADFIRRYIHEGDVFADIGCGTGIFTVEALRRGAEVIAIDLADSALEITRKNVEKHAPGGKVTYLRTDVQKAEIPRCTVALAMGVTPYIEDLEAFMSNVLPRTTVLYCQYTDPWRLSNMVRRAIPALNVRKLVFHSEAKVDRVYRAYGYELNDRSPFATGFIDLASATMAVRT